MADALLRVSLRPAPFSSPFCTALFCTKYGALASAKWRLAIISLRTGCSRDQRAAHLGFWRLYSMVYAVRRTPYILSIPTQWSLTIIKHLSPAGLPRCEMPDKRNIRGCIEPSKPSVPLHLRAAG